LYSWFHARIFAIWSLIPNRRAQRDTENSSTICAVAHGDGMEIIMRNKNNKHLGIEIDPELHYKLHYISKYYGRSANGEILYLIRQEIKAFEKAEGEIEIPEAPKQ